jgi:hypothetical protein
MIPKMKFAPILLALAFSGCVYALKPAPEPDMKPVASSLPLSVGIVEGGDDGGNSGRWAKQRMQAAGLTTEASALTTALLRTGLFHDVRPAGSGSGFDLTIELNDKQDRTMHAFFPLFLPFCDPLLIGCLPIVPVSEKFTAAMRVVVNGGKTYAETGEAGLDCQGPCGCAPAAASDPLARASAVENAAAKIAVDFLNDAAYYRGLAQTIASRRAAIQPERSAPPVESPSESPAAAPPAAAPAAGAKPWWQQ